MRIKREYRSASKAAFESFSIRHPGIKISYLKWKQIIFTCNRMFITHALETANPVKLPSGFSVLVIHKYEARNYKIDKETGERVITIPIDWEKTKKEGKKIYNFNFHTSGFSYKWKWFPRMARIYESAVWVFKPSREASRLITKYVRNSYYAQLYKEYKRGNVKMIA